MGSYCTFFVNGFIQGGWAVQITQPAPRFGADDIMTGRLILTFGLGALFLMPLRDFCPINQNVMDNAKRA